MRTYKTRRSFCSFANAPEKRTLLQNHIIIADEIYKRNAVMLRRRNGKDHSL